jgi:hypothetical protein
VLVVRELTKEELDGSFILGHVATADTGRKALRPALRPVSEHEFSCDRSLCAAPNRMMRSV